MSYELISREQQKARKPHVCTWCGETIEAGEDYERTRFVFEGDPMTNKMHMECVKAATEWSRVNGGEPFEPGEFKRGTCDQR